MESGMFWIGALMGALAVAIVIWALVSWRWARCNRRFTDFDAQARSLFDDYEPEGTTTDHFPRKGPPPSEYLL